MPEPLEGAAALSPAAMKAIVAELAEVKSRQDVEAAMRIYHPEGVLACPPLGSIASGADAMRSSVAAFFRFAPDYMVDIAGQAIDGDTLCAWGEIGLTSVLASHDERQGARYARTPVFILFRFRERRVVWESFHFDLADVARQAGVPISAFAARGAHA
jgi:ketosteroid isomerase-like protein